MMLDVLLWPRCARSCTNLSTLTCCTPHTQATHSHTLHTLIDHTHSHATHSHTTHTPHVTHTCTRHTHTVHTLTHTLTSHTHAYYTHTDHIHAAHTHTHHMPHTHAHSTHTGHIHTANIHTHHMPHTLRTLHTLTHTQAPHSHTDAEWAGSGPGAACPTEAQSPGSGARDTAGSPFLQKLHFRLHSPSCFPPKLLPRETGCTWDSFPAGLAAAGEPCEGVGGGGGVVTWPCPPHLLHR